MLAACGGERNKKEFLGTPRTPAEGFALCPPDESDFRNISDPGRAAVLLYSIVCI